MMQFRSEFANAETAHIQDEFQRLKGTFIHKYRPLATISQHCSTCLTYGPLSAVAFNMCGSHSICLRCPRHLKSQSKSFPFLSVSLHTDIHYLDHAGATQYSERQLQQIYSNLSSSIYCNPHTSKATEDLVDQVRYKILNHFNTTTDDYSVVFTSGATASLKLVAETFDFDATNGTFVYARDSHTSMLGMREVVQTKRIKCLERDELINYSNMANPLENSLFVYSAQCNFNGYKYPLELVSRMQSKTNHVCVDAANFVGTNHLDLTKYRPDFVCLSFYKLFGYPSGLGALLVSKRGETKLRKRYYGGGTVKISFSDVTGWHQKRDCLHERYDTKFQFFFLFFIYFEMRNYYKTHKHTHAIQINLVQILSIRFWSRRSVSRGTHEWHSRNL